MEVKILFTTSKELSATFGIIEIGKYKIEPLPTNPSNLAGSKIRHLLRFEDSIREGETVSQPLVEAQMFLSFFSLMMGSRLDIDSSMINDVKTDMPDSIATDTYKEYRGLIDSIPDFDAHIKKLMSSDYDIAKQFLRACEVYRTAVNLIGTNNTLSFFLLSIAIECLSNKISTKTGTCEKFVDFIYTYLPDKSDFATEEEWISILKEIYYSHISGFTHGGKLIPEAVRLADKLNRKYVRNTIDGRDVRTPGLKWFEAIVRNCLIGFISKISLKEENNLVDYFKEISLEYGIINLKKRKNIIGGQIVTTADVELD
ncbi:MAG: hypothetical protein WAW23_03475 [Candidatus Methanoperedens sp.]